MWNYRRMLKLSWTEHKSNGEVLQILNTQRSLLDTIKKRKLTCFGHIIKENNIQQLVLEGKINGRHRRGRPQTNWTDNIKDWTQMRYHEYIRLT